MCVSMHVYLKNWNGIWILTIYSNSVPHSNHISTLYAYCVYVFVCTTCVFLCVNVHFYTFLGSLPQIAEISNYIGMGVLLIEIALSP